MPNRNPNPFTRCAILVALGSLTVFTSCKKEIPVGAASKTIAPIEVTVASAEGRDVPRSLRATGNFAADESADIAPQVAEKVIAVPVAVGQFVEKGAVLVQLDRGNLDLRLRQAKAAEDQAQAGLLQAESRLGLTEGRAFDVNQVPEVKSAQAAVDNANSQAALAETNSKRYAEVLKSGDVSQSSYDQAAQQAHQGSDVPTGIHSSTRRSYGDRRTPTGRCDGPRLSSDRRRVPSSGPG